MDGTRGKERDCVMVTIGLNVIWEMFASLSPLCLLSLSILSLVNRYILIYHPIDPKSLANLFD